MLGYMGAKFQNTLLETVSPLRRKKNFLLGGSAHFCRDFGVEGYRFDPLT